MATPFAQFVTPVRLLLGERFGATKSDADLSGALLLVLRLGRVTGHAPSADLTGVTPDLAPPGSGTPLAYAQLVLGAALALCAPDAAASAFDTRAYRERLGDAWPYIEHLRREIYLSETGGGVVLGSWQSFAGFMAGLGLAGWEEFWATQSELTNTGGFTGVSVGGSGATLV